MSDDSQSLQDDAKVESGASHELLPLVYASLRRLAAQRMAAESPDHTLQPTALVHEAYLRLERGDGERRWDGRGHFFAAAAEAMRRILVESARRKSRVKHGGGLQRVDLEEIELPLPMPRDESRAESYALHAVGLLRKALAKGYSDPARIESDADLDALRSREDFRELIAEMENSAKRVNRAWLRGAGRHTKGF